MADTNPILSDHVDPVRICNPDMEMLAYKWDVIAEEALGSQSTETSEVIAHDVKRIMLNLDDVDRWCNFAHSAPKLDLPETSKRTFAVQPETPLRRIENDALFTIARYAVQFRDETLSSQSARNGCGMRDDDFNRQSGGPDAYTKKMRQLITDYVNAQVPQDLPASTPTFATVDSASHGV